jgi:hypothetical protein
MINTISSEYLLERLSAYNLENEAAIYHTIRAITVNRYVNRMLLPGIPEEVILNARK